MAKVMRISDWRREKRIEKTSRLFGGDEQLMIKYYEKRLPFDMDIPLKLNIRLAHLLGIVPVVMLTRINELLMDDKNTVEEDNRRWVPLTHDDIAAELGNLWSTATIRNALSKLKVLGFLHSKQLGHGPDRTNYYWINTRHLLFMCTATEEDMIKRAEQLEEGVKT